MQRPSALSGGAKRARATSVSLNRSRYHGDFRAAEWPRGSHVALSRRPLTQSWSIRARRTRDPDAALWEITPVNVAVTESGPRNASVAAVPIGGIAGGPYVRFPLPTFWELSFCGAGESGPGRAMRRRGLDAT